MHRGEAGVPHARIISLPSSFPSFTGGSASGGERRTHDALRRWWERCFRLLPTTRFDVQDVIVGGWPWNTRVATAVTVHVGVVDGSTYENVVHQFLRIRWGKITEVRTLEDTAVLQRTLDRLAAAGYA
ncbi:MAG TPA: nuclear transport factor 2 family protein [Kribbella sp.]